MKREQLVPGLLSNRVLGLKRSLLLLFCPYSCCNKIGCQALQAPRRCHATPPQSLMRIESCGWLGVYTLEGHAHYSRNNLLCSQGDHVELPRYLR